MDAPRPMPTTAAVLRFDAFFSHSLHVEVESVSLLSLLSPLSSLSSSSSPELFDIPLLPVPVLLTLTVFEVLPLVESASAVALTGAAACAPVARWLVEALDAGVEVADTVGERTVLGGSVDGTELSLVLRSAAVLLVRWLL